MSNFILTVFQKMVEKKSVDAKGKETTVKFPKWFGKVNGMKGSITVRPTNAVLKDIENQNLNFPLDFELSVNDYFLTTEEYENSEGILLEKAVCVIQNFHNVKEAEIEKATLEDYFKGLQNTSEE